MGSPIEAALQAIQQHTSALDRELARIAPMLAEATESQVAGVMSAAVRAIQRLADAARAVRNACPVCRKAEAATRFEEVNKFSGVWSLPDCPTCRGLARLIAGVDKAIREAPATGR